MLHHMEGIDYLTYPHTPDYHKPALIIFHGYGAHCHNLYPLIHQIDAEVQWYFPNGLYPAVMGEPDTRTWFPIKAEHMQHLMEHREQATYGQLEPPGFSNSLSQMQHFISHLLTQHASALLAGFSQGAMILPHLAAQIPQIKGMLLFSTNLMHKKGLEQHAAKTALQDMPFLQSHGQEDHILSFTQAERDFAYLRDQWGCSGTFTRFTGGHEIPAVVCHHATEFIKNRILH